MFEYLGDYLRATLRGAGGLVATIINVGSIIFGFAVLAAVLWFANLQLESFAYASLLWFAVLVVTHYGSFVAYQKARRHEAELETELEKRAKVEVHSAYPIYHVEENTSDAYILIAALNIINRTDKAVDCDLTLHVALMADHAESILPLESDALASAKASLPGTLKGHKQYVEPIEIGNDKRVVGFAAFRVDEVHKPSAIDSEWSNVERMVLTVWDAVNHVAIIQHEVWPSVWPSVFAQEDQQWGRRTMTPLPRKPDEPTKRIQQSGSDKVVFLPRRVS